MLSTVRSEGNFDCENYAVLVLGSSLSRLGSRTATSWCDCSMPTLNPVSLISGWKKFIQVSSGQATKILMTNCENLNLFNWRQKNFGTLSTIQWAEAYWSDILCLCAWTKWIQVVSKSSCSGVSILRRLVPFIGLLDPDWMGFVDND